MRLVAEEAGDDEAVPAAQHIGQSALIWVQAEARTAVDDGGELRGRVQQRRQREEARGDAVVHLLTLVEAEESRRMELAEPAQEGAVRGEPAPAPTDHGGADEAGREADADDDLCEEVVIVQHLRYTRRQRLRLALHLGRRRLIQAFNFGRRRSCLSRLVFFFLTSVLCP